jgi:hypothetical protein
MTVCEHIRSGKIHTGYPNKPFDNPAPSILSISTLRANNERSGETDNFIKNFNPYEYYYFFR